MFDVSVTGWEGGLDALVQAVMRGERDALSITIAEITAQCLTFIAEAAGPAALLAADGLAAGAWLLLRKSAALLPLPPVAPECEAAGEDEPDPSELAELLREYQRYKIIADVFRDREVNGIRSFPRLVPPPPQPRAPGLGDVTLEHLAALVREVLRRTQPAPVGVTHREVITVRERLAALEAILSSAGQISFIAFVGAARTRIEVVVSFLAVLELIKRGRVAALQPEPFGDIILIDQVTAAPIAVAGD